MFDSETRYHAVQPAIVDVGTALQLGPHATQLPSVTCITVSHRLLSTSVSCQQDAAQASAKQDELRWAGLRLTIMCGRECDTHYVMRRLTFMMSFSHSY